MSAPADNDTRKRRWDDNEDDRNRAPAAAASTAEHALPPAETPAEAPAKRRAEKAYTADVDINDSSNRQTLAKSSTHRLVTDATDAEVTTRGRYYADPEHATPADPVLHLHIEAYTQESLDQAIAMIERLKAEPPAASAVDHNYPKSPSNGGDYGSGDHNGRVGRHARPGSSAGSASGSYTRLQDKVYVDIESERGFNVRAKLIGTGGENMKYIQNTTGARVQVRGRGSGFNDREGSAADPFEPMHLYVSVTSEEALVQAKGYCQSLIDTIRNQYYEFKQAGGAGGGRRHHDGYSHGGGRDGRPYQQRTRNHQGGRGYNHSHPYQGSPAYYGSGSPAAGYGHYPQQHQQQQYNDHGYETSSAAPPTAGTPVSADASAYGDYSEYYAQYYQYYGTYPDYSAYYGTADQTASETTAQPASEPTTDTDKKSPAEAESPSSNGYHSVPPPASYANGNNKTGYGDEPRNKSKSKSKSSYRSSDPLSMVLSESKNK